MKTIAIWTVSLVVFGVVALTGFKVLVEAYAKQSALDFVGQAEGQMNLDALAIDLTKRVYEIYLTSDPQEKPFLLKLRPFVTHTGLQRWPPKSGQDVKLVLTKRRTWTYGESDTQALHG
jgi:hypothetical protein